MFKKAKKILQILSEYGEAYIVGGAVRDNLLGLEPHDIDICTNVPMEKLETIFKTYDIGQNKTFGIVCIEFENEHFEIAQFRNDGAYSDGRRPDEVVFVNNIYEDLSRRDFTINAMAIDKDDKLIDPHGGVYDLLTRKELHTVGNPENRFEEDYLRILRAIRFSSRFSLTIPEDIELAIFKNVSNISSLSKERVHQELWKMASETGEVFSKSVFKMFKLNIFDHTYPEISLMNSFVHSKKWHPEGGVFWHVVSAISKYKGNDPFVNFSILFHDIGKPLCYQYNNGKHSYIGHDLEGSKLVKEVISVRMKWPNDLKDIVRYCCEHHMAFHQFEKMKTSKCVKLIIHDYFKYLKEVSKADTTSRNDNIGEEEWIKIQTKIDKLSTEEKIKEYSAIYRIINGNFIMKNKFIDKPGPRVGWYLEKVRDWVINHNVSLGDMNKIIQHLKQLNCPKEI